MTLLNKLSDDDTPIPIAHICKPERLGKDMTGLELQEFGISLLITFLHIQGGNLITVRMNPQNGYPNIVVENPKKLLLYVWVKTELAPNVPVYKPDDSHGEMFKLLKQLGAVPAFAGIMISCASAGGNLIPKCGGEYYAIFNELEEI